MLRGRSYICPSSSVLLASRPSGVLVSTEGAEALLRGIGQLGLEALGRKELSVERIANASTLQRRLPGARCRSSRHNLPDSEHQPPQEPLP